jgi:hypothetical protein
MINKFAALIINCWDEKVEMRMLPIVGSVQTNYWTKSFKQK